MVEEKRGGERGRRLYNVGEIGRVGSAVRERFGGGGAARERRGGGVRRRWNPSGIAATPTLYVDGVVRWWWATVRAYHYKEPPSSMTVHFMAATSVCFLVTVTPQGQESMAVFFHHGLFMCGRYWKGQLL